MGGRHRIGPFGALFRPGQGSLPPVTGRLVLPTILPANAGIARLLARFAAAEESLAGQINAHRDVVEPLRLHPNQRGPLGCEGGQCRLLVLQAQRLVPLLPGVTPRGQQMIVEPATLLKLLLQETLLLLVRVQSVLERLKHTLIIRLRHAYCQAGRASHPPTEAGGFLAPFL